jgi:NitT/TauT family transport system permease protein
MAHKMRPWAVVFWLAAWQLGSCALGQKLLLPSPVSVLASLAELLPTADFWRAVGGSALRIWGGFLLSCLAGTALAALASRWRWVGELLYPLMAAVKAVPVVSFIILALVWLDSRSLPLFIAGLMVLPPVYLNVLAGIEGTDRQLLEMARVFRVPLGRQLRGIWLPQVLPYFRSAASLGLGLCWKSGVAAEVIGLPDGSVGERLYMAKVYFKTPELFAWTAVIVALSAVFEKLFFHLLDRAAERSRL